MFERTNRNAYLHAMLRFLRVKRNAFEINERVDCLLGRRFRKPITDELLEKVEAAVNRKSAQAESAAGSFGSRYELARDYMGLKDSDVAGAVGVSRESIRQWRKSCVLPKKERAKKLAVILNVSVDWLVNGVCEYIPEDSHLGVRVGAERRAFREELYGITVRVLDDLSDNLSEQDLQRKIACAMTADHAMKLAMRRAGGRWCLSSGKLQFITWAAPGFSFCPRKLWPDETEAIIKEELGRGQTTYAAWQIVKQRCEEKALPYPKRVTLHKRVQRMRSYFEEFGLVV